MMNDRPLEYYRSLVYSVTLDPDPEGGYVAGIEDLPGYLAARSQGFLALAQAAS
jgi:hypothetical protein